MKIRKTFCNGMASLIVGHYEGDKLMYVARTRDGLLASRRQVFSKLKHLET